jgi:hypothetical protein
MCPWAYRQSRRTGGDRAGVCRDRQLTFQDRHDVVNGERFDEALVWPVAAKADADPPVMAFGRSHCPRELSILSRRALDRCVGDGKLANSHEPLRFTPEVLWVDEDQRLKQELGSTSNL